MRKIFHDDALQAEFLEPGFVKVPLLSGAEVDTVRAAVAAMRPHDNFVPDGGRFHCSYLDDNEAYRREVSQVLTGVFEAPINRYLNGYAILNCNFYVKPPGAGEFVLHQNWPAAPLDETTLTVWCPLQDVEEANGGLQFVPGSHKIVPHIEGPNVPGFFKNCRDQVIANYLLPVPVKAGEAMIFDDAVIHWSPRNQSATPRIAIQIMCVPRDVQPVFHFFDPAHPDRFEVVAVDAEFFLKTRPHQLCVRDPAWVSLGFVENRNVYPDEAGFRALLDRGPDVRRRIYARTPA